MKTSAAKKPKPRRDPDAEPDEPPAEDKTPTPELDEVPSLAAYAEKLKNLINRRDANSAQIKKLAETNKEFDARIALMMRKGKTAKVRIEGHPVAWVTTAGHSTIDRAKLLELGVRPKVIQKATKWIPHKPHLRVDPRKKES